jgi:hypothetical protein
MTAPSWCTVVVDANPRSTPILMVNLGPTSRDTLLEAVSLPGKRLTVCHPVEQVSDRRHHDRKGSTMAKRIVCTEQSNPQAVGHGHILAVGVGVNAGKATEREDVATVRRNILYGERYYTKGEQSGRVANVERYDCWCGVQTIRSAPDAVTDNNLDNLRLCSWSS